MQKRLQVPQEQTDLSKMRFTVKPWSENADLVVELEWINHKVIDLDKPLGDTPENHRK